MYGHIPNVYTITDGLIWSYTHRTYLSLDQIRPTSWDTHVGIDTSAYRIDFSFIYIIILQVVISNAAVINF
jgi:hypothetical protein